MNGEQAMVAWVLSALRNLLYKTWSEEEEDMATTPGGYFQKNWVGVCDTLPETLALFQTKICDFFNPISYLIKNLLLYFKPIR